MHAFPIGPGRLDDFLDLPRRLHGRDPGWIAPLRLPLEAELNGLTCFAQYGRMQCFLCEGAAGEVLGRVAAIVNPRLADAHGAPVGHLGYFECADDRDAARRLLEAGADWLREAGAREAWAPSAGGAHRTHRVMTKGFDRPPFLFEPRNPAYYPALLEAAGFRRIHAWHSFELATAEVAAFFEAAGIPAAAARARRTSRLELLDARDATGAIARVHGLLDRLWEGHLGYAPFDPDEFAEGFAGLLAIAGEERVGVIVDGRGRDVGLALTYPDYAAEVRAIEGDVTRWGEWLAPGHARARSLVWHTIAFLPEARRSGAPALLMDEGLARVRRDGFEGVIVALVDEDFPLFRRAVEPAREYALYARALD